MSILRSPVLIVGILLILAAGIAGIGPFFINWDIYKPALETQATKVFGRTVKIDGPVSLRLFPWPVIKAAQVRIANPPGALLEELARIDKFEAEIAPSPLLSGRISMRKIRLVRPEIALERLATGEVNWKIGGSSGIEGMPDADQIAVAGIEIIDGKVYLGDGRRGGLAEIGDVEGTVSAPSLQGPWRAQLVGTQEGNRLLVNVSTGKRRPKKPLNFHVSVTPQDDVGFVWEVDGETLRDDGKIKGKLSIAPHATADGRENPLNSAWQIRFVSDLEADFDNVRLDNIQVAPANRLATGNLMTGNASIRLGSRVVVDASLEAASIDLDSLAGQELSPLSDSAGFLEAATAVLESLPGGAQANLEMAVTSLVVGGETLTRAHVQASATPEALRIGEVSAGLPGQTRARFSGVMLPAASDGLPQLAGEIGVDSISLRDLAVWALPDKASQLAEVWTGARGRAAFTSKIGLTPNRLRLSDAVVKLDDASAKGSFLLARGDAPSVGLRIIADRINVDRYLPKGFSARAIEAGTVVGLTDLLATALAFGDAQFTIQADRLTMRGVDADDIAIDVGTANGDVELRTVEIGGIGDARLDIAGVLKFPDDGVAGSVSGTFKASDPRPFLRLVTVLDAATANAPWAKLLGPVDLKLLAEISTSAARNSLTVSANGNAAGATIAGRGQFAGRFEDWQQGDTTINAIIAGTNSASLLALAGLTPVKGGTEDASLVLEFKGKPSAALTGTATLNAFAGRSRFEAASRSMPPTDCRQPVS